MTQLEKRKRRLDRKKSFSKKSSPYLKKQSKYKKDIFHINDNATDNIDGDQQIIIIEQEAKYRKNNNNNNSIGRLWSFFNRKNRFKMAQQHERPIIDVTTLAIMKIHIEQLLKDSKVRVTVLSMANALLLKKDVIDVYAEYGGDSTSSLFDLRSSNKKSSSTTKLQRRYTLINALNRLQTQAGATSTAVSDWDEALERLQTEMDFITINATDETESAATETATDHNDIVDVTSTKTFNNSNKSNLDTFRKRMGELRIDSTMNQIGLRPSQHKLQEIIAKQKAAAAVPLPVDEELEALYEKQDADKKESSAEIDEKLKEQELQDLAKEKVKQILRPLTNDEKQMIYNVMHGGNENDIIAHTTNGTDTCNRKSFQTLQPGVWLNDEVIHFFLDMLTKRDEIICNNNDTKTKLQRSHFFKSFFITKLRNDGHITKDGQYEYKNVKRWSKKVPGKDIFKLDKIFFPINQGNMHWTSACVFMKEKKIQFYDSMGGDGTIYIRDIFQYVQDEHIDKKKVPLPDIDQWELITKPNNIPRQRNGYDCGVFTCMFADFISINCPLIFGQEHVDLCRERIALSILQGKAIM